MDDAFARRVRAAAVAGWWTLLIAAVFLTLVWIVFLGTVSTRPAWYLPLLGPGASWEEFQRVGFWAVAIFKMCLWVMAVVVVWLTLWARRLQRPP